VSGPRSDGTGADSTPADGRPPVHSNIGARSLSGAYSSAGSLSAGSADALEIARRAYAQGRVELVLHDLEAPAQMLAQAAERPGQSPVERARAARDAASAWTLVARAARRSGKPDLALDAAKRALVFHDIARAGATTPSDGSASCEYAIALFLAGRQDEAATAMSQASQDDASWPEMALYQGVLEHGRRHFDDAVRALERARPIEAEDLEQLRLETLAAALAASGPERVTEAIAAYTALASQHFVRNRLPQALESLERARDLRPDDIHVGADRAEVLRTMGRLDEALAAFGEVLTREPRFAWALTRRGETLRLLGRYDDALVDLTAAVELDPNDQVTLASRGETLRMLRRYQESIEDLDKALARDPRYVWALTSKGDSLRMLGRHAEAIATLDRALAIEPNDTWALMRKGESLQETGDHEAALAAFSRAAELNPGDEATLTRKCAALRALGRDDDVVAELDKVLGHRPNTRWALTQKVEALVRMGRHGEAIAACDAALAVEPDAAAVLARKGDVLRQMFRYDDALVELDRSVAINPDDEFAQSRRGETLRMLQRFEESVVALDLALAKDPRSVWSLTSKADSQAGAGRFVEAIETFDFALSLDPSDAWALAHKGDALRQLSRYDEALAAFDAALAIAPADDYALSRKGETLRMLGRHEESVATLDAALERKPDSAWSLSSKADSLRLLKRYAEAEEVIRKAIAIDDNTFNLGVLEKCLSDQGRDQEALAVSDKILEQSPGDPSALESKALSLVRLDRIEAALEVIGERIATEPVSAYALGIRGITYLSIEEYDQARLDLERAGAVDPGLAWVQNHLAHCYMRLAADKPPAEAQALLAKAEAASRVAVGLEPEDSTWRQMLGDVLWRLGPERRGEAGEAFDEVLRRVRAEEKPDYYAASSGGWAAFRQSANDPGRAAALLAEAEAFYVEALAAKRKIPTSGDAIEIKFFIALAVLCGGRFGLALREYDSALELTAGREPRLQRGLIGRARADLVEAIDDRAQVLSLAHAMRALEALGKAYAGIAKDRGATEASADEAAAESAPAKRPGALSAGAA